MSIKHRGHLFFAFVLVYISTSQMGLAGGSVTLNTDKRVAEFFEKAKGDEASLIAFLHKMPKGADLHIHPGGAVYPEGMIDLAIEKGLFYDRINRSFVSNQPADNFYSADDLRFDYLKYNEVLDSLSIRNISQEIESGNVHFFTAFERFGKAIDSAKNIFQKLIRYGIMEA